MRIGRETVVVGVFYIHPDATANEARTVLSTIDQSIARRGGNPHPRSGSVLDLAWTTHPYLFGVTIDAVPLNSDHLPLTVTMKWLITERARRSKRCRL